MQGSILKLIKSFLISRKVKLIVNKTVDDARICGGFGVPQGSVLSPLLFIMYISDMFDLRKSASTISSLCKEHSCTYKYADDGSILVMHKDPTICNQITQEFCNHISQWCRNWKLIVNCEKNKTECLIITAKGQPKASFDDFVQITITGKKINFEKSTKVLGLVIDSDLIFNQHASKILQRCWFSWYNITKNSNRHFGLNISSLVILFKTVILRGPGGSS